MTKSKKFNKGYLADYFPFKLHRFDTTKHPCVLDKQKTGSAIRAPFSDLERRMLSFLEDAFQTKTRDAVRITIYEASLASIEELQTFVTTAKAGTKVKLHGTRNKEVSLRLPKNEKGLLQSLSKELDVSEKECLRLVVIWMSKNIRDETITKLTHSKKKSQKELHAEWRDKNPEHTSSTIKPLKKARQESRDKTLDRIHDDFERHGDAMDAMRYEANGCNPAFLDLNGEIIWDVVHMYERDQERAPILRHLEKLETYEEKFKFVYEHYLYQEDEYDEEIANELALMFCDEEGIYPDEEQIEEEEEFVLPPQSERSWTTARELSERWRDLILAPTYDPERLKQIHDRCNEQARRTKKRIRKDKKK